MGIFLTDDPWNPHVRPNGFLRALPEYTAVWTPRTSNLRQLCALGCAASGTCRSDTTPSIASRPSSQRRSGDHWSATWSSSGALIPIGEPFSRTWSMRAWAWRSMEATGGVSRGFSHSIEGSRRLMSFDSQPVREGEPLLGAPCKSRWACNEEL